MRDFFKESLYLYQRIFYYVSLLKSEVLKPLGYWNETLLLLTFLKVSGGTFTIMQIAIAYVAAIGISAILGKLLVITGIVAYNAKIANQQNPELIEIRDTVKEILEHIKQ